jgi:hypothetical protein
MCVDSKHIDENNNNNNTNTNINNKFWIFNDIMLSPLLYKALCILTT